MTTDDDPSGYYASAMNVVGVATRADGTPVPGSMEATVDGFVCGVAEVEVDGSFEMKVAQANPDGLGRYARCVLGSELRFRLRVRPGGKLLVSDQTLPLAYRPVEAVRIDLVFR